jgi:nitrogen fixation NifU-like protein
MNIYQQILLDHYRNPRNCGKMDNPSFSSDDYNPSCGDSIAWQGKILDNLLIDLRFTGKGCVISQAGASLLSEYCKGKNINATLELTVQELQQKIGIELGPMRIKCLALPLYALQKGLTEYNKCSLTV